ncbi:MAG: outer membrane protein transport protein [Nitrospirae bacterium]|nr:outer membrane protein transport protein [Nitrospirota bacterium]
MLATNGYQLIGVGQVQKSMGGAVTAAPLDTMTAISNPAGMARVGERADFSMEAFMPVRSVDFGSMGGGNTNGGSELYGIPSVGWVAKAFNRDNVYFGGGMFATSGLGVDYGEVLMMPGTALDAMAGVAPGTHDDVTFDGFSGIQFWKMAPTVAWNVNDRLSLGASLNLDYQSVTIMERLRSVPFNPPAPGAYNQMDVNLDLGRPTNQLGVGATVGALYDVSDKVTIGFSYATEQVFGDGDYRVGSGDVQNYNGAMGTAGIYKLDLDYPQQAAVGIAFRPDKKWLIDFDIKWLNWSGTHDKVTLKGPSNSFDTDMNGIGDSNQTKLEFGWEDQYVYAIGAQYQANDRLALRAGFNYGKAPIDEADVFNNLIFPAYVERHLTCGLDYQLGAHWGIGGAYKKAFKETVTGKGDVPAGFTAMTPFPADSGAKTSLEEDSIGLLISYRFR